MDFSITDALNVTPEAFRMLQELFMVLGIGLMMGLEREYSNTNQDHKRHNELFAGVRTFPLVAIIGYLALYLSIEFTFWVYAVALAGISGLAIVSYSYGRKSGRSGSTTELSIVAVFLLSGLVFRQQYLIAAFLALVITTLLALKVNLHQAVRDMSKHDILSILLFVVISALILPLLPNTDLGPYAVFNPFRIWLIVTLFMALNFIAYFLQKFIDTRYSIIATGIIGGFASSTATAWYFSRLGGKSKKGGQAHVAAILFASSIMFPRLLLWLALLSPTLFNTVWLPFLLLGAVGFSIGYFMSKQSFERQTSYTHTIRNPINLKDALVFAGLYVLIVLLVGYAEEHLGTQGVYYAAAISGLTDVDAITISITNYLGVSIHEKLAVIALVIASLSNTLTKYMLCLVFGNAPMRKYASLGFIPLFLGGIGYILYLTF